MEFGIIIIAMRMDKEIWRKMGKAGFLCTNAPKEYGGHGLDFLYSVIVIEELARTNQAGLMANLHSDIIVPYITSYGSEEIKKKYVPGTVTGDTITAVAMTEPDAGSDLVSMKTTAIHDGDSIIINGSKTFISNGINCGLVVVVYWNRSHLWWVDILVCGDTQGWRCDAGCVSYIGFLGCADAW